MECKSSQDLQDPNQNEEAPSAKKIKIDVTDESAVALIKKPKLLRLNCDLLEEILPQFGCAYCYDPLWKSDAEGLRKFMSSGKEPFAAALRYFTHVSSVELTEDGLIVSVKRFPLKKDKKENWHFIRYDFQYFQRIFEILAKFNKKLIIGHRFEYYTLSDMGKQTFAYLVREDLESVFFQRFEIPADYHKFFKNVCSFKEVQIDFCLVQQPALQGFLEMNASEHCIITHFQFFYERLMIIPKNFIFPTVKHLIITPGCECEFHGHDEFMFTKDAIKNFFDNLIAHFPNLQILDVSFRSMPEEHDTEWDTVYAEMMKFTPQIFSSFPPHLKGSISFDFGDLFHSFGYIMDELGENPGVEIVDNYYKVPSEAFPEESKLIKKFDIHDGLTFKYVLGLHRRMSEDSLMELIESESDDENVEDEFESEESGKDEFESDEHDEEESENEDTAPDY